eukprot:scaffold114127_cov18-Tisochrysis_lutea.AAC.2
MASCQPICMPLPEETGPMRGAVPATLYAHASLLGRNGEHSCWHTQTKLGSLTFTNSDGCGGQGRWGRVFEQKEADSKGVELEADCLEEGDVVAQHLLVLKVKVGADDVVDVVVGEQEEDARLAAHVLNDDAQCLQHLRMASERTGLA